MLLILIIGTATFVAEGQQEVEGRRGQHEVAEGQSGGKSQQRPRQKGQQIAPLLGGESRRNEHDNLVKDYGKGDDETGNKGHLDAGGKQLGDLGENQLAAGAGLQVSGRAD